MTRPLCALVLTVAALWPLPLRADTLCVRVIRGDQPAAGERVTVGITRRNTDGAGRVCFDNVASGEHQILVGSGPEVRTCYGSTAQEETVCHVEGSRHPHEREAPR